MAVVLMLALVCTMLSFSTAKVSHAALNSTGSNKITTQAQNYAESKANLLKKTDYYKLSAQGKANIPNSNHFSDEVIVGTETVLPSDSSVKQRECIVNVYQEEETIPRATIRLIRYSKESSTLPKGSIIPWFGKLADIPAGYALCDETNGTPDLRDRFIVGAGNTYKLSDIGGENTHILTIDEIPSHNHQTSKDFDEIGFDVTNGGGGESGMKWRIAMGDNRPYADRHWSAITGNAGGNQAHENRPPYYALYYIMQL